MWLIQLQTLFAIAIVFHHNQVHANDFPQIFTINALTTPPDATTQAPIEQTTVAPHKEPKITALKCQAKVATVTWIPPSDNKFIEVYRVESSNTYTPDKWNLVAVAGQKTFYTVLMKPGVTYNFRVIALYRDGRTSPPSEPSESCASQPEVPHTNPFNLNVTGLSKSMLLISWTPMVLLEHGGDGFYYAIYWREYGSNKWDIQYIEYWRKSNATFRNLKPVQYEFKVISGNKLGESKDDPQVIVANPVDLLPTKPPSTTTAMPSTTEAPTNVPKIKYFECDKKLAKMEWRRYGDLENIKHYQIEFSTTLTPNEWMALPDQIRTPYYDVHMNPGLTYTFRVKEIYQDGNSSPPSLPTSTCTTDPDVPYTTPSNVTVKGASPSAMAISWSPLSQFELNGPGFYYKIYWRKAGSFYWNQQTIYDWQVNSYVLKLLPVVKYEIKVTAGNQLGESNIQHQIIIAYPGENTPTEPPPPPTGTTIEPPTTDAPKLTYFKCHEMTNVAFISWEPPRADSSYILHYTIQEKSSLAPNEWKVAVNRVEKTFLRMPLSPGASLQFRVITRYINGGTSHPSQPTEACRGSESTTDEIIQAIESTNSQKNVPYKNGKLNPPSAEFTTEDVPYRNPKNVKISTISIRVLFLSWEMMREDEHNGPDFHYRIYWRKTETEKWKQENVWDWKKESYLFSHLEPVDYEFKIVAANKMGESRDEPEIVVGRPGKPTGKPQTESTTQASTSAPTTQASTTSSPEKPPKKAPKITSVKCGKKDAKISFDPQGSLAKIKHYTIEASDASEPHEWTVLADEILVLSHTVSLIPSATITFRVIAIYKDGSSSEPSAPDGNCERKDADVPFKNPSNVEVEGVSNRNLIVSWTPMRKFEQSGPGFFYRIYRRKQGTEYWFVEATISDWKQGQYVIEYVSGYYEIKVIAGNKFGESKAEPKIVVGHPSHTTKPPTEPTTQAPTTTSSPEKPPKKAPKITSVKCGKKDAKISFDPQGDLAKIKHYTIEASDASEPHEWTVLADEILVLSHTVSLIPSATITFRVVAIYKDGSSSEPSAPDGNCERKDADVPFKNPSNVEVEGVSNRNLIVSWTPMRKFEQSGPEFFYRIYRRKQGTEYWYVEATISDWKQGQYVIEYVSGYYEIKVIAGNKFGESKAEPEIVVGHPSHTTKPPPPTKPPPTSSTTQSSTQPTPGTTTQKIPTPPGTPRITSFKCIDGSREAKISWEANSNANIKNYVLEYNSYKSDKWNVVSILKKTAWTVDMRPGVAYKFRVITNFADNKKSPPSQSTAMCASKPDVPYKNPENVNIKSLPEKQLVISWSQISEEEHNGAGFFYRIYYKKVGSKDLVHRTIFDGKKINSYFRNLEPVRYEFKVVTGNDVGECRASAQIIVVNPNDPSENPTIKPSPTEPTITSTTSASTTKKPSTTPATTKPTSTTTTVTATTTNPPPINAPIIISVICDEKSARVTWVPRGQVVKIKHYTIEFSASFAPYDWTVPADEIHETSHIVPLSPGATFKFRVITTYKDGRSSEPSAPYGQCTTKPDVPYTNPENAIITGTKPGAFVISWKEMPQILHNGPGFFYRLYWKKDTSKEWNVEKISNWKQTEFQKQTYEIAYHKYVAKVEAVNYKGVSSEKAKKISGFSGEYRPFFAPDRFTVKAVKIVNGGLATVKFDWKPLLENAFNGNTEGYKIQVWSSNNRKSYFAQYGSSEITISDLLPDTEYNAHIQAVNKLFQGPTSAVIPFRTPQGVPEHVQNLEAKALGSTAVLLKWSKPEVCNGQLTGFNIYYEEANGGVSQQRIPQINDPNATEAKMNGLKANTEYRFHVAATTAAGEGQDAGYELKTNTASPPTKPSLSMKLIDENSGTVRVKWMPQKDGNPGSKFYVKYCISSTEECEKSIEVIYDDFTTVILAPKITYDVSVVSIDGEFETESDIQKYPELVSESKTANESTEFLTTKIITIFVIVVLLAVLGLIAICIKCFIFKRYYPEVAT